MAEVRAFARLAEGVVKSVESHEEAGAVAPEAAEAAGAATAAARVCQTFARAEVLSRFHGD